MKRSEVVTIVRKVISECILCDPSELVETARLGEDLKICDDDASFDMIPRLQETLGFRASDAEWRCVVTVGGIITLVESKLCLKPE